MTIKANMSIQGSGKLLASGDVVIDDQIFLHQVKVIEGNEGLIVSLPKKKMSTGAWVDVVELPPELYQELKNKVIEAVRTALAPDQRYMVTLYPVVRYGASLAEVEVKDTRTGIKISDIQIRNGRYGIYVSWPKNVLDNGTEINLVTLPPGVRDELETSIIAEYKYSRKSKETDTQPQKKATKNQRR